MADGLSRELVILDEACHHRRLHRRIRDRKSRSRAVRRSPIRRPTVVEFENPLASPPPLQGYLRQTNSPGPSPAVVLLHSCNGNWKRLDERWGKRIASWGYVTLTVDSFGPRGLKETCDSGAPVALAFDAYRAAELSGAPALRRSRPRRGAGLFARRLAVLTSVERGTVERTSPNKFRAAIAFYPPCLAFQGRHDRSDPGPDRRTRRLDAAGECRNMVDGRDDFGISRRKGDGIPMQLVVYPGAYHAFDAPDLKTGTEFLGHHLEFNQAARDLSMDAVRQFLDATIGGKEQTR